MSWLSEYRRKSQERKRIIRFLVDKGEIDMSKYDALFYAEGMLLLGMLSFLLPLITIDPELEWVFGMYPEVREVFLVYSIAFLALFFLLYGLSLKLDREVSKKVKAFREEVRENDR